MPLSLDDIIIAQASANGCGIEGILRMSGHNALDAIDGLFAPPINAAEARNRIKPMTVNGTFTVWDDTAPAPCKLYFWRQGHGYTGQESIELHLPCSPPILHAIVNRLITVRGVRLANRGEFTLRAFLSGKIDLTQAEAVLGVIDAPNRNSVDTALAQLAGGLSHPLQSVRETLISHLSNLEAKIDFADEPLDFVSVNDMRPDLQTALERITDMNKQFKERYLANKQPLVVIIGLPNAGKSSLYNCLCGDKALQPAIVSDTPGTTRDYLKTELEIDGQKFQLCDTAGYTNETFDSTDIVDSNTIEQKTQQKTLQAIKQGDIFLLCAESNSPLTKWQKTWLRDHKSTTILVRTKQDLHEQNKQEIGNNKTVTVSAKTGQGIESLQMQIRECLQTEQSTTLIVPATAQRCRNAIETSLTAVKQCILLLDENREESILASELQTALNSLDEVVGAVYTEDVLEKIFSKFCIGK
ncbi:MAG: 50S ribosome-binding GTPase [Planctomycetaceae bacterium]|jgi:tRNA modification GTPase|nr:50S ribosome-binding GTPase [Planctomycetaceae bacterium]